MSLKPKKMATLIVPGLQFYAESIPTPSFGALGPTMSSYGIPNLEGAPRRNELYVVCRDGSIQSVYEPERPIGWELLEEDNTWYYRVTQMNHKPEPCLVRFHGKNADPPAGRGKIGSVVFRACATPACAEISHQNDDGEEVDSELAKIAKYNPDLAIATMMANDPVQTNAMAKFAEGKMSYAEMRGLCG